MRLKTYLRLCVFSAASAALVACGGGGSGSSAAPSSSAPTPVVGTTPPAPAQALPTDIETEGEASDFIRKAGLGGTSGQIASLNDTNAAEWIRAEMRKPSTLTLDAMLAQFPTRRETDRDHSDMLWKNLLEADDQLRQRMMFALSQIFVISDNNFFDQGPTTAYYTDILTRNAFGNYRDLLEEVTYSPAMASYLTYYRNRKGDPRTGRMPDENYAREVLQLFSIGLVDLNMDGTPKLGADGQPIESYGNDDIIGLARVFTGMSADKPEFWTNDGEDERWRYRPLKAFDSQHSELEKTFLGTTIPANTGAETSIQQALDTIANHPNVAPFISRQLIQRFTASSPSPAYVERVARVFEAGRFTTENDFVFGTGLRGDLGATLAAILLDPSVHDGVQDQNEGKLREPVLKFVHVMRAFDASPYDIIADNEYRLNDTRDPGSRLGQHPLRSPSVFNFYRPGYLAPGTETGAAGLSAPELQIVNETSAMGFANFMADYVIKRANDDDPAAQLRPNFVSEIALADTPVDLVAHLNEKLCGGQMSEQTQADIIDAVTTLNVDADDAEADRLRRVQLAVMMSVTSGAFAVQN